MHLGKLENLEVQEEVFEELALAVEAGLDLKDVTDVKEGDDGYTLTVTAFISKDDVAAIAEAQEA